ncbi:hypothetical protein AHMF7605_22100 [Adhaeribacter arboris]|uniref:Uncharacterized protein n=1 Tax=Adhaeribacter arboris TaxID=2072846 RepID=A0A2T2YKF3_9BACT|nr:hypothetical protein AHMF7605_22100 [Adhaeribacter arboris]
MLPSSNQPNRSPDKVLKYFALTMCLLYPALGLFIMLSDNSRLALPTNYKVILGIMLIVYGVLRFYRAYKKYFPRDYPNENS